MAAAGTVREISYGVLAAAFVAAAMEAASNAAFAFELGGFLAVTAYGVRVPIDGAILAAGSIAVAVFQARSATLILRGESGSTGIVPFFFLAVCVAYSTGAMTSHLMKLQRLHHERELDARKGYDLAASALKEAEASRDRLETERGDLAKAGTRSQPEIKAEMERVEIPKRIWRRTAECTEATEDESRAACAPFFALRQELARAIRADELGPELAAASVKVADARRAFGQVALPVQRSEQEVFVTTWLPWLFAAVIEACGTFGFALAYRPRAPKPRAPANAPNPVAPPSSPPPPRRRASPAGIDLAATLESIRSGTLDVEGARVVSDGWIELSQRSLGAALGVSATTVNSHVAAAVADGRIAKKASGRSTALKVIYPPISAVKVASSPAA